MSMYQLQQQNLNPFGSVPLTTGVGGTSNNLHYNTTAMQLPYAGTTTPLGSYAQLSMQSQGYPFFAGREVQGQAQAQGGEIGGGPFYDGLNSGMLGMAKYGPNGISSLGLAQSGLPNVSCMSPWPATPMTPNQTLRPAAYGSISPPLPLNAPLPMSNTPVKKEVPESLLELTRDDLLKFSSAQYEDFVKEVSLKRSLTTDERREVKRQRRLIKNREYAQTSRNKKKEQVGNMESQLEALAKENTDLKSENASLSSKLKEVEEDNKRLNMENRTLKEKMALLGSGNNSPSFHSPRAEAVFPAITETASTGSVSSSDEVPSSDESSVDTEAFLHPPSPPHQPPFNQDFFTESFLNDDYFSPEPWANPKLTLYVVLFCFAIFLPPMFFPSTSMTLPPQSSPIPSFQPHQHHDSLSTQSPTSLRLLSLTPEAATDDQTFEPHNETYCKVPDSWVVSRRIITMDDVIFEEAATLTKPILKVTNKSFQVDSLNGRAESYFDAYSNQLHTQEPAFFRSLQSTTD